MTQGTIASIRIMDRDYTVGVAPGEHDDLVRAAELVDKQMREIRGVNRSASVDRIAVLAALNIAHELRVLERDLKLQEAELQQGIIDLNRKLDRALDLP